jgi:RNA ligase
MQFPFILSIDDVLPAIAGREAFFVKDLGDWSVINYRTIVDAFENEITPDEMIRRECRGIKFHKSGLIAARPFQKFWNLNERAETKHEVLPWKHDHFVSVKWDGSMIHPCLDQRGSVVFMTKMGRTDTALKCEASHLTPALAEVCKMHITHGFTPIFEWVAPWNRIVIGYEKPELVLLAIRDTHTGRYFSHGIHGTDWTEFGVRDSHHELESKIDIEELRKRTDIEGVVVSWMNGTRVKIKTDQYVLLHRAKDRITSSPKDAIAIILDDALDDALPILDPPDQARMIELKRRVSEAIFDWTNRVNMAVYVNRNVSQKAFALSDEMTSMGQTHQLLRAAAFECRKNSEASAEEEIISRMRDQCSDAKKAQILEDALPE